MMKLVDRLAYVVHDSGDQVSDLLTSTSCAPWPFTRCRHCWRWPLSAVCGAGQRCSSSPLSFGAIMLGFTGEIPVPLRPGNTWTLAEVGGSRGLINGLLPRSEGTTIEIVLRGAGLLAFGLALMSLTRPESDSPRALGTADASRPVFRRLLEAVNTISMTPTHAARHLPDRLPPNR